MDKIKLSYLACETAYEAESEYQKPPGPNRSFLDMKRQATRANNPAVTCPSGSLVCIYGRNLWISG